MTMATTYQRVNEVLRLRVCHQRLTSVPGGRTKPIPRTVWINFVGRSRSILRRSLAMWTSMTLSSGVDRGGFLPHVARQGLPRDDLPLVPEQVLQQLELADRELDRAAAAGDLPLDEVHLEVARGEADRFDRPSSPAQERSRARQHFREGERFHQIVVGAAIEAVHAILERVARGQEEHRCDHALFTERREDLEAVAPWQHDVEQHEVERLGVQPEKGSLSGALDGDLVALAFEPLLKCPGHLVLVLDDEQAGGGIGHAGDAVTCSGRAAVLGTTRCARAHCGLTLGEQSRGVVVLTPLRPQHLPGTLLANQCAS